MTYLEMCKDDTALSKATSIIKVYVKGKIEGLG